jgi:AcrR family transcriptional regulator
MSRSDSDRRRHILESAIRVFAAHGLEGATIRQVGREARLNSALMYYYFENKQTLFAESIRLVVEDFIEHLRRTRRPFRGARDRLAYLVDGVLDYYRERPSRMRLMTLALSRHGDLIGRVLSRVVGTEELVPLDVLREGMARGELRRMHPVQAWWRILGLCIFSLQFQNVFRHVKRSSMPFPSPRLDAKALRSQILSLVEGGIARKDKRTRRRRKE